MFGVLGVHISVLVFVFCVCACTRLYLCLQNPFVMFSQVSLFFRFMLKFLANLRLFPLSDCLARVVFFRSLFCYLPCHLPYWPIGGLIG